MTLFLILILVSFILLISEYWTVHQAVNKIPTRILVNGTRGKSSVVKYIAAALRAADKKTTAKITGILPTIIYPDASEKIIKRIGPARIQEQFKMIRLASKLSSDCLVLECMSVTPELQKLESKIFKPNIYVITNIRDDHKEQMGDIQSQINAVCDAIPTNSIVVTAEEKYFSEINKAADSKNSSLIDANEIGLENSEIPDNAFFSNIKIALAVCQSANVVREKSEKAILELIKKSQNSLFEFYITDKKVKFINGFAVNDVQSAEEFLQYWERKIAGFQKLNIIFNSRSDRPLRSLSFAKWIISVEKLNRVVLTGSHIPRIKLELVHNGIDGRKIIIWTRSKLKNVIECFKEIAEPESVFVGLGNIAEEGLIIVNSLKRECLIKNPNDN